MARAWMGIALLALAACTPERPPAETALISKFTPLTTQEEFVAKVVGKPWKQTGISVHFLRDGTLGGMVGREPLSGTWTWKDGQLCALYRASDAGGDGCAKVGLRPGEMLMVPRNGTGAPMVYQAG